MRVFSAVMSANGPGGEPEDLMVTSTRVLRELAPGISDRLTVQGGVSGLAARRSVVRSIYVPVAASRAVAASRPPPAANDQNREPVDEQAGVDAGRPLPRQGQSDFPSNAGDRNVRRAR